MRCLSAFCLKIVQSSKYISKNNAQLAVLLEDRRKSKIGASIDGLFTVAQLNEQKKLGSWWHTIDTVIPGNEKVLKSEPIC